MNNNAIIITNGLLSDKSAKTAHGLIRSCDRFRILGVIDATHAGKDAGEVIDGRSRGFLYGPTWKKPYIKVLNPFITVSLVLLPREVNCPLS